MCASKIREESIVNNEIFWLLELVIIVRGTKISVEFSILLSCFGSPLKKCCFGQIKSEDFMISMLKLMRMPI